MRQKDFTFIARLIRELPESVRNHAAYLFANRFACEYPHFRSSTFYQECGITEREVAIRYVSPQADNKRWGWSYDDGQAD